MLNQWKLKVAVPVASAAVLAGCSGETKDDNAVKTAAAQTVALSGCVSTGIGTNQYVLTNIRFAPLGEQPAQAPSYPGTGLTEHSQVRLSTEDESQLRQLVGQMASVQGTLKDDGRNTIGTSGPAAGPNDAESRTDQSQQGTKQSHSEKVAKEAGPIGMRSMNNGTFPEVQVLQVTGNGQPCQGKPVEDKR